MKLLPPFLRYYLLAAALLLSGLGFGQVTYFDEDFRSGPLPSGWGASGLEYQTGAGGYIRFNNFNSELITPIFDGSSYTSIDVTYSVANFGSGGNSSIIVEYSNDGGATWSTAGQITTSSGYTTSTISISVTSVNIK